jgi:ATP-dependent Lon protease
VHAERILSQEHAGLHQLKERILEYLAVRTLKVTRNYRLLVVDDEEIARSNLEHILKKEGYDVSLAEDGAEALKHMESTQFDLILTDLLMIK